MLSLRQNFRVLAASTILAVTCPQSAFAESTSSAEATRSLIPTSPAIFTPTPTPTATPAFAAQACSEIDWSGQAIGVQNTRLWLMQESLEREHCVILNAGQYDDIASIINNLPADTSIFLSSHLSSTASTSFTPTATSVATATSLATATSVSTARSAATTTPMSTATSVATATPMSTATSSNSPTTSMSMTGTPAMTSTMPSETPQPQPDLERRTFTISSPIDMKDGQHLLAAPDPGYQIVLAEADQFSGRHMVAAGSDSSFNVAETQTSVIRNIIFETIRGDGRQSVDSIIFNQCSNRLLRVEGNHFMLDARASIYMYCARSNQNVNGNEAVSPYLQFSNNIIEGRAYSFCQRTFIPDEGVFVSLPYIQGVPDIVRIENNAFIGVMSEAIEVGIGLNSSLLIANNDIRINDRGNTRADTNDLYRGGILIRGKSGQPESASLPLYELPGNTINVTDRAITLVDQSRLGFACNNLTSAYPWNQVSADPVFITDINALCSGEENSGLSLTPSPSSQSNFQNTWEPSDMHSTVTPCDGLRNIVGLIHFNSVVCQVTPPSTSSPVSSNSSIMPSTNSMMPPTSSTAPSTSSASSANTSPSPTSSSATTASPTATSKHNSAEATTSSVLALISTITVFLLLSY